MPALIGKLQEINAIACLFARNRGQGQRTGFLLKGVGAGLQRIQKERISDSIEEERDAPPIFANLTLLHSVLNVATCEPAMMRLFQLSY
jgi:hypothetical protein